MKNTLNIPKPTFESLETRHLLTNIVNHSEQEGIYMSDAVSLTPIEEATCYFDSPFEINASTSAYSINYKTSFAKLKAYGEKDSHGYSEEFTISFNVQMKIHQTTLSNKEIVCSFDLQYMGTVPSIKTAIPPLGWKHSNDMKFGRIAYENISQEKPPLIEYNGIIPTVSQNSIGAKLKLHSPSSIFISKTDSTGSWINFTATSWELSYIEENSSATRTPSIKNNYNLIISIPNNSNTNLGMWTQDSFNLWAQAIRAKANL